MNQNRHATVIDVRTPQEFHQGAVEGSINIPLDEVEARIEEIRKLEGPVILCCASGSRSGLAEEILTASGIACENGGPWFFVAQQLLAQ